jgi:porin
VSGDPNRPKAFAAERFSSRDGVLLIAEADYRLTGTVTLSTGAWRYTRTLPSNPSPGSAEPGRGAYVSLSSATPPKSGWAWWARAGLADPRAQVVSGYLGGGVVYKGFAGRPDDRVGFAVARASIGPEARTVEHLPNAETTLEASYQAKLGQTFAVQPDVQYVIDPSGRAGRRSALVLGLRLIFTGGYPAKAKPEDTVDPTLPPDTPSMPIPG